MKFKDPVNVIQRILGRPPHRGHGLNPDLGRIAAQACSNQRYTWHHAPEERQAAADAGYPYGLGDNLTVFTGTDNAAQRAVDSWINSPGHFGTLIDPRCDCIGVGVTQYDGITCYYMFVGIPNSVNFYA